MRLSRLLLAVPLLVAARRRRPAADDTDDFLKPDNWDGRADSGSSTRRPGPIVGETMEDPKYNTFFCRKKKYGDFELSFKVQLRDGVGQQRRADPQHAARRQEVRGRAARRWTSARATGAACTARASAA